MIRKPTDGNSSGPAWFKSSHSSGPDGDSCVEVATTPGTVHVRDSKNAMRPPARRDAGSLGRLRVVRVRGLTGQNLMLPIIPAMFVVRSLIVGAIVEEAR